MQTTSTWHDITIGARDFSVRIDAEEDGTFSASISEQGESWDGNGITYPSADVALAAARADIIATIDDAVIEQENIAEQEHWQDAEDVRDQAADRRAGARGRPPVYDAPRKLISLQVETALLDAVDERAGRGNRNAFIEDAIREKLARDSGGE